MTLSSNGIARRKRIALRAVICAAALLGLLAAASPALASRAFLKPYVTKYEADPGEDNQVAITGPTNRDGFPTTIDIEDPGATRLFLQEYTGQLVRRGNINPSWPWPHYGGCKALPESEAYPTRVWCVVEEGLLDVSLGDGMDSFDMGLYPSASVYRTRVLGGRHDDELLGGLANDFLYGGDDTAAQRRRSLPEAGRAVLPSERRHLIGSAPSGALPRVLPGPGADRQFTPIIHSARGITR
jgi:hypothetical protein